MAKHDMCEFTLYCRKCGASGQDIAIKKSACVEGDNVVGISHLLAAKKWIADFGFDVAMPNLKDPA